MLKARVFQGLLIGFERQAAVTLQITALVANSVHVVLVNWGANIVVDKYRMDGVRFSSWPSRYVVILTIVVLFLKNNRP